MIIKIRNLSKTYKSTAGNQKFTLNIESLSVREGDVYFLLGPNGSGKTTLIKLMLDLIFKDKGHIELFGINHTDKMSRSNIGYLPEEFSFPSWYKFSDAAFWFGRISNDDSCYIRNEISTISELLNRQGLLNKNVGELSKGMTQSLGLLNALIGRKKLLLLDEPFNGLDPEQRMNTMKYLVDQNKNKNTTILITTHILSDAEAMSTRIGFIKQGKILIDEFKDNILKKHSSLDDFYFSSNNLI